MGYFYSHKYFCFLKYNSVINIFIEYLLQEDFHVEAYLDTSVPQVTASVVDIDRGTNTYTKPPLCVDIIRRTS